MTLHVFRLVDKQFKNICTHSHIDTQKDWGRVASLSCTLIHPGWMEKNSVVMEKGTSNTQCMYKEKQKKTFQHEQLYYRIKNNDQKTVNLHLMEKKQTRKQNSHQYNYKIFSCSVQRSTLKCISTLGLAPPAESNPTERTTQYVTIFMQSPPHPPQLTPSCAPTAGDGNRVHYADRSRSRLTCSWLKLKTTPGPFFSHPTPPSLHLPRPPHSPCSPSHHVNMATWRGARSSTWKCEVKPVQLQILSSS